MEVVVTVGAARAAVAKVVVVTAEAARAEEARAEAARAEVAMAEAEEVEAAANDLIVFYGCMCRRLESRTSSKVHVSQQSAAVSTAAETTFEEAKAQEEIALVPQLAMLQWRTL
jgi:hypothetical protein